MEEDTPDRVLIRSSDIHEANQRLNQTWMGNSTAADLMYRPTITTSTGVPASYAYTASSLGLNN